MGAAQAVARIERLELQVSIRGHANDARHLDRDDGAGIRHLPWHWRGIIRALQIHGWVGKVVSKVALRRDHNGAVLHSETDRTPFGFPDRALYRIVLAVEVPWIGKVTVVGHVDVVGARPHERADDRLREEETVGVAGSDTGDLDVGSHTDDTDGVLGRRDRPCGVGAVTIEVVAHGERSGGAAKTVGAVRGVVVRCEIRMREVETCINVANKD